MEEKLLEVSIERDFAERSQRLHHWKPSLEEKLLPNSIEKDFGERSQRLPSLETVFGGENYLSKLV